MVVAHISRKQIIIYALLALCFALPLFSRLYTLAIPVSLNPDEAQWTVSARRILDDPIVWRSNDLTTSGPLNALVISWPYLFGFAPSIFTSRLTGAIAPERGAARRCEFHQTRGNHWAGNGRCPVDSRILGVNDRRGLCALQQRNGVASLNRLFLRPASLGSMGPAGRRGAGRFAVLPPKQPSAGENAISSVLSFVSRGLRRPPVVRPEAGSRFLDTGLRLHRRRRAAGARADRPPLPGG